MRIPLFPLHAVLFPGAALPLHVFEERYRRLVREGRDFGVVLIRHGWEVGEGRADDIWQVGTLATPERVDQLPDGRYFVLARGTRRFRVISTEQTEPYPTGEVEWLPDPRQRAGPHLLELLRRYLDAYGVELTSDLARRRGMRAVWLVGDLLQVEALKRQQLLEAGDPGLAERLLEEELIKIQRLGRLASMRPPRVSKN